MLRNEIISISSEMACRPVAFLVVEHDEYDAELAVKGLQDPTSGVTVTVALNGRAALDYLTEGYVEQGARRPDVVLLSVDGPLSNDLETLAALKADPELSPIPVVVLAASPSEDEIARAYELGVAAVVAKPMRLAAHRELLRMIACFWLDHAMLPSSRQPQRDADTAPLVQLVAAAGA